MSWVEVDGAGWSWVEVGARFSNIQLGVTRKYSHGYLVKSDTPVLPGVILACLSIFGLSSFLPIPACCS